MVIVDRQDDLSRPATPPRRTSCGPTSSTPNSSTTPPTASGLDAFRAVRGGVRELRSPRTPATSSSPVVSVEKSYACMTVASTRSVAPGSNKTEIKQAVEAVFDVKVSR